MQKRIIAETSDNKPRHSKVLEGGQPVFIDGGHLAFATGWEQESQFEVRLDTGHGRGFGQLMLVRAVVPSTDETLAHDRVHVAASELSKAIELASREPEIDDKEREALYRMQTEAVAIITGIDDREYGDLKF